MSTSRQDLLRQIPSVDALLQAPELAPYLGSAPRRIVVACLRQVSEEVRNSLLHATEGGADEAAIRRQILHRACDAIRFALGPYFRKAVNATGIVLHTALGRAPLPAQAVRQIAEQLGGYSLVQVDVQTGRRAKRDARIEWLLQQLTGAEAATVVNNNAAATAIVLNTLARGKEVIVSRGQLVEIGGAFRLPDVMEASGAKLVEVGTTNRTHLTDYERAITAQTAAILRVHPSNYRITGFTAEVPLGDLVRLAHGRGILLIDDVGAGPLVDFTRFGFKPEPTLQESVHTGADIITASADKLIGASQGGIILGKAPLVQAVRKNPLARIVRVGKLTLAALEATLTLFLDESRAMADVPTLRMLRRSLADITQAAERIAAAVGQRACGAKISVIRGASQMGGGSLPGQDLATRLVAVRSSAIGPDEIAQRLRRHAPPVFARIRKGNVLVDPRTLLDGEEAVVIEALAEALQGGG